jgi:hypothetical protein
MARIYYLQRPTARSRPGQSIFTDRTAKLDAAPELESRFLQQVVSICTHRALQPRLCRADLCIVRFDNLNRS